MKTMNIIGFPLKLVEIDSTMNRNAIKEKLHEGGVAFRRLLVGHFGLHFRAEHDR
jgi:hypothetical protein